MSRSLRLLPLVALLLAGMALAQPPNSKPQRTEVVFSCTCDDPVGSLYATAFRDLLADSPRYTQTTSAEEKDASGKITKVNWQVSVVSLGNDSTTEGENSAALAVVDLLGDNFFVTESVQTCGRQRVKECAAATLSNLDSEIYKLRQK